MHFAFTDEQLAFYRQLRALTERWCTPSDIRTVWDAQPGWSAERWRALADLGVTGMTVPDSDDGLGLGLVDLVLVLQEAGWAALPEPLLATTALGVPMLLDALGPGTEALRREFLPRVAGGRAVIAVAEPGRRVCDGAVGADLLLTQRQGLPYAVLAADARVTPVPSLDGVASAAVIEWDARHALPLGVADEAERLLVRLADRAATATAAVLIGLADRMVDMAVGYSCQRRQFGVPVGSFQTVKQQLADAATLVEFSRPLVYRAAWSLDVGDRQASMHASMAKAAASDAAVSAARTALQVHGAIGYTWEHDLHLWMKRTWRLASAWGGAPDHRSRVLALAVAARQDEGRPR